MLKRDFIVLFKQYMDSAKGMTGSMHPLEREPAQREIDNIVKFVVAKLNQLPPKEFNRVPSVKWPSAEDCEAHTEQTALGRID